MSPEDMRTYRGHLGSWRQAGKREYLSPPCQGDQLTLLCVDKAEPHLEHRQFLLEESHSGSDSSAQTHRLGWHTVAA